ncbi:MAG: GTPase Era [Myxococcota bacterium]|nr:GTPase Era [Myxococcota bacterium]
MVQNEDKSDGPFKSGFVALVGRPNVGKSTLTNALLGEKISIVSPKAQTTRTRIHGILNRDAYQMVLVDTPGFCGSETPLRRVLRRLAGTAPADSDLTLIVTEITGDKPELSKVDLEIIDAAQRGPGRVVLAINKIDRIKQKELLLPWIERYVAETDLEAVIPISAKYEDGLDVLERELLKWLPEGPALFPDDMHTDQIERQMCEELIREQLLFQTHKEVPHSAAVVIESFEDGRDDGDGMCRLQGRIIVERDSQKAIVIGNKGARIKAVSTASREAIEDLLGAKVFLRMEVAVDKEWTKHEASLRRYGIVEEPEG